MNGRTARKWRPLAIGGHFCRQIIACDNQATPEDSAWYQVCNRLTPKARRDRALGYCLRKVLSKKPCAGSRSAVRRDAERLRWSCAWRIARRRLLLLVEHRPAAF